MTDCGVGHGLLSLLALKVFDESLQRDEVTSTENR